MTTLVTPRRPHLTRGNGSDDRVTTGSGSAALRAQARVMQHPVLTVVGIFALLALTAGLLVLTLAPGEWFRAGGVTAVAILTLCVVASIWSGEQR